MPTQFLLNNNVISDPQQISNEFNKFFASIGHTTSESVRTSTRHYSEYLTQAQRVNNNIFLDPVHPQELITICNGLKSKTSSGHDNISTKLLKDTITNIATPLTHIINQSFIEGNVPNKMKLAKVIPIFKTGNNKIFNNYRPISLLPAFSKLLEKTMAKRLVGFLEHFDILYEHQYGFRKKHSTIHPILHFLKAVSISNDKPSKDSTLGIFLDLSKAFDTINHSTLLSKLNFYGIRGIANSWFKSYLSDRYQYTEVNGIASNILESICGVPQGSILGPILFLVYINDIRQSTNMSLLSFADDTTVYASNSNISELYNQTNIELVKMEDWFCANKLSLNIKKTKFALFSPNRNIEIPGHCNISLNNLELDRIGRNQPDKSIKFLGIQVDENLTWVSHVRMIKSKLSRSIFALNKVKNIFPHDILKTLYYSLIQSHIVYGLQAWGNTNAINQIENLQKRAIRIINRRAYRSHTDPLFRNENILKITDLYKLQCCLFVFDFKHGHLPKSFLHFFPTNTDTNSKRINHISRNVVRPRTTFSEKLPFHNFPVIWNGMNNNIISITNRTQFKRTVKSSLISMYEDNVTCTNPVCPDCNPE